MLLRHRGRRAPLRLVFAGAIAGLLLLAPSASALVNEPALPQISVSVFGTLGTNGWYVTNVTVNWSITVPDGGPIRNENCTRAQTLNADTAGITLTCEATTDGGTVKVDKTFRIDKTVPTVATSIERQPDANGWYNRPFTVTWSATDATSGVGVGSCASLRYSGPDNPVGLIAGSCRDNAGNEARSTFPFKYDATAPALFAVTAKLGNRSAQVAWRKSTDTRIVEVLRAPGRRGQGETVVYRGSAAGFRDTGLAVGRKYEYRVAGIDDAANRTEQELDILATGPLLSPAPGAKITGPTTLVWTPVKHASYYNVQLIRGRKVLSAWPARPGFRLRRTWTYDGRRYRLRPGVYRWYVWPGFGPRAANRYSKRPLGS
ncbi:MAG TPA: hypothetical protein VFL41_12245, partial [Gaiellaceae bacterium]|nr:hypothetical protein [Gaiellaceae bacterium]